MRNVIISLLALVLFTSAAEARHYRRVAPAPVAQEACFFFCDAGTPVLETTRVAGAKILPHPGGCPARSFCGCGASVRVFGRSVRSLWLAANWLKFPRTAPQSGMVAARRGHVFVLESHVGGNNWIVYDANSGRGRTRIHERSIAGFSIVNPHGAA